MEPKKAQEFLDSECPWMRDVNNTGHPGYFPTGARALIWIRRTDGRGREDVGWLVNGLTTATHR